MATTTDTYDYLYYYNDNLFTIVSLQTLHTAQEIVDGDGRVRPDGLQLTEEDRQTFDKLLKRGAMEVFRNIRTLSEGIANGLQFGVDLSTLVSTLDSGYGVMFILSLHDDFDENIIDVIDVNIEEAMTSFVVKEWWRIKGVGDYYEDEEMRFQKLLTDIKADILSRTEPVYRPHRSF